MPLLTSIIFNHSMGIKNASSGIQPCSVVVLFIRSPKRGTSRIIRWLNHCHVSKPCIFLTSQPQGVVFVLVVCFMLVRFCPQFSISSRNQGQGKVSVLLIRKQNTFLKSPPANLLKAFFTRNQSNGHS